jgi:hypothetical protein
MVSSIGMTRLSFISSAYRSRSELFFCFSEDKTQNFQFQKDIGAICMRVFVMFIRSDGTLNIRYREGFHELKQHASY